MTIIHQLDISRNEKVNKSQQARCMLKAIKIGHAWIALDKSKVKWELKVGKKKKKKSEVEEFSESKELQM